MPRFHSLTVTNIAHETRDSVVVTLQPQAGQEDLFRFTQGQYLTFRKDFAGQEVRRCYSICSGTEDQRLQVGIKKVEGGAFSCWANDELAVGQTLEAMPPAGSFYKPIDEASERHHVGFAGGSGITPVLSILKTVLAREPQSRFTLVYANREVSSIMFREELEDLKNKYLGRLHLIHILKRDALDSDLLSGRVDREKVDELLRTLIDPSEISQAYLCGPHGMMETVRAALADHGVPPDHITQELFKSDQPGRLPVKPVAADAAAAADGAELLLTLDGTTRQLRMLPGETVLEAAHRHDIDAPYSCCAGVCSTCRGRVLDGEVDMAANHALEDDELRDGYVLTCQSRAVSGKLTVTYDA
ncbi:ferredoxin--NADP reductase [Roseibium denhamense]|uniref:Ring-1,2-phenylacetyl-CoA epoxidase subunit PaaE n=1 Tax=Roseibium denhamense TaxID=76305 RepID=A0ABY1PEN6_9HYPH|nr:ferredoxin--NADP reductase [Roseibium denhamense]MTI06134.1 ferredoxin--NADP reductase [Roseibium denhamense]SMP32171.1 ring-1,2-phenylacetyl-CoA epoxidase subunit PaaE [Roseibium denhamense]